MPLFEPITGPSVGITSVSEGADIIVVEEFIALATRPGFEYEMFIGVFWLFSTEIRPKTKKMLENRIITRSP